MDLLNDIGRKITATAKTVTKKSEDIVEITRLNLAVSGEEDKVKRMLYEIGSELYRSYINGKTFGDFYDTRCAEVQKIEDNIKVLKERILLLKGSKPCKACASVVDAEVNYCPNCGEKLENKEEE
jgi:rRNA maturation endonuclease Nob1